MYILTFGLLINWTWALNNWNTISSDKANNIRLAIQRGETEQVEAYKQELFANLKDITLEEAEVAWQRLTNNPRAFLKAHAVSRVMAKYKFEF